MKLPRPDKPLTYNKDRNFTRRTVAGAAGGMLGVDYEDPNRPDPSTVKATAGAGSNRDTPGAELAAQPAVAMETAPKHGRRPAAPKEESEMVLEDEDATTRDQKAKQQARRFVPRDRMTIDKDAPDKLRKPRWYTDDEPPEEPDEIDLDLLADAIGGEPSSSESRAFVGDPRLTDPHAIKEALGSPVAYAKHCMVLAEAYRSTTGATRSEAIAYLALMFAALGDRAFCRQALKELGPATGIIDLYPLEVVEHVVESYPGLLPKVGFGTLFLRPRRTSVELEAGVPYALEYPASLKIRAFAIKGGSRPGYRFEPSEIDGRYLLTIFAPGRYRLLISAVTRSGHTVIDRLDCAVEDGPHALPSMEVPEPVRDDAKVAAWPKPEPIPIDYSRVLEDEAPPRRESSGSMLFTYERICLQQLDALKNACEERVQFVDAEEPSNAGLLDPDDVLSRAEAALLKLAVVLGTEEADVSFPGDDEE